jgi:RNA polymerase sigma factor (sigma-70 family)
MTNKTTHAFVRYLSSLMGAEIGDEVSDADLLGRFVATRDERAFEALLRRHGPLVLGVCRRRLWDPQDVEDAFQATFLVLVQKAGSMKRRELLGNWLYGVANRIAQRARISAARRLERQRPVEDVALVEIDSEAARQEARAAIDEEILRLPEKYRVPIVLCYFEDKTHAEAGRLLGWPTGTVATRLTRARQRLRSRLTRRGLALSIAGLSGALTEGASAALPSTLANATLKTALTTGSALTAGGVSANVAALASGAARELLLDRLKIAAILVLAVTLTGVGAGIIGRQVLADTRSGDTAKDDAVTEFANTDGASTGAWREHGTFKVLRRPGMVDVLAFGLNGKLLATAGVSSGLPEPFAPGALDMEVKLWDPANGNLRAAMQPDPRFWGTNARAVAISPDGKSLASAEAALFLWNAETGELQSALEEGNQVQAVAFSPDGKTLAFGRFDGMIGSLEVATGKTRYAGQGHSCVSCVQFSADGETLFTVGHEGAVKEWNAATLTLRASRDVDLCKNWKWSLAADGKALAMTYTDTNRIAVWDAASGKVRNFPERADCPVLATAVIFAPDGETLAAGYADGTVILWSAADGKQLTTLGGEQGQITALAYSPDGRTLASADVQGTVTLWTVGKQR